MLMDLKMMSLTQSTGENTYRFDTVNATRADLREAIGFEESYADIYGHQIFDNLSEIKQALKKATKSHPPPPGGF